MKLYVLFSTSNLEESTPSLESSIHCTFTLVFNFRHFHSPIEVQPTKIILKEKRNALEPPLHNVTGLGAKESK